MNIKVMLVGRWFIFLWHLNCEEPPPTSPPLEEANGTHPQSALRRELGFAPLCGVAATSVATLKTPVAPREGSLVGFSNGLIIKVEN